MALRRDGPYDLVLTRRDSLFLFKSVSKFISDTVGFFCPEPRDSLDFTLFKSRNQRLDFLITFLNLCQPFALRGGKLFCSRIDAATPSFLRSFFSLRRGEKDQIKITAA